MTSNIPNKAALGRFLSIDNIKSYSKIKFKYEKFFHDKILILDQYSVK